MNIFDSKKLSVPVAIFLVLILGFLIYGWTRYRSLGREFEATKIDLGQKITALETKLSQTELEKTSLSDALIAEQEKNNEFEDQIRRISKTVGTLDKLSKTDPELLKKYSKVYFLNENYVPAKLTDIDSKYLFDQGKTAQIHTNVWPFLRKLFGNAGNKDLNLKIVSAFRSFSTQSSLKSNYKVIFGVGTANQFSADQGYSEHQLGTTVDFSTPSTGATLMGFETTPEYKWLTQNAYKYGFILSYPAGNAYYQFEPWHWRFVGIDLATWLHDEDQNFYDVDQRGIDKYLISIFDP